jgi:hypothetical protein
MKTNFSIPNPSGSQCAAVLPLLSEFIDGVLPSESAWSVQKHITLCPDCARSARDLQRTASLLAALPPRPLSQGFDTALSARIAAASAARAEANRSPVRRLIARLSASRLFFPVGGIRPVTGAITALAACAVFFAAFALNQPLTPSIVKTPAPIVSSGDSALVAACLTQHHATVANEPLSDPSAQILDAQLDTDSASAPPDAAQSQGLSEADAVALVNETD